MKNKILFILSIFLFLCFSSCGTKKVTLTIVPGNGESNEVIEYNVGDEISSIKTYNYPGHGLASWYFDKSFKKKVTFPFVINENTTIYGYWYSNLIYDYDLENKTCKIIGIYYSDKVIEIPSESLGFKVTEIADFAFSGNDEIQQLILPDTITKIGDGAFSECERLEIINLPQNLEEIGDNLFSKSPKVRFKNVFGFIYLDNYLVDAKEATDGYTLIEDGTKGIFPNAFKGNEKLTTITIPEGIEKIRKGTFEDTLIKTINLPSTIKELEDRTFSDSIYLEEVNIDENNEDYASVNGVIFSKDLTNLIYYPIGKKTKNYQVLSTVKIISDKAFMNNKYLENITLSTNLETIGQFSFYGCTSLLNIEFKSQLIEIENEAFSGCCSLKMLAIPSSVKKIGSGILKNCTSLTELHIPSLTLSGSDVQIKDYFSKQASINIETLYILGGTIINKGSLSGLSKLNNIYISSTIQTIEQGAFNECINLTNLNIEGDSFIYRSGVLYSSDYQDLIWVSPNISYSTFYVDTRVKTIYSFAFNNNEKIKEIWLNDNLENINSRSFANLSSLVKLVIKKNIKMVGEDICYNTPNVTIYVKADMFKGDICEGWNTYNYKVIWNALFPTIQVETLEYVVRINETFTINFNVDDAPTNYKVIMTYESDLITSNGFTITTQKEGSLEIELMIEGYPDSKTKIIITILNENDEML